MPMPSASLQIPRYLPATIPVVRSLQSGRSPGVSFHCLVLKKGDAYGVGATRPLGKNTRAAGKETELDLNHVVRVQ